MEILRKIGLFLKNFFISLGYRLKPRLEKRWIFGAAVWLIVLVYVGLGIFYGLEIYKYHAESRGVKIASKFFPLPAVMIDGRVVWASEYFKQLNYIERFSEKTKQSLPDAATLRAQITDQLIENQILEYQALKYNIKVTSKDVNDAYQKIVSQSGGTSEVKKVLSELYGMSESEFKDLVRQQVLKEKVQNELIRQMKVAHILIKDEGRANEIADRARKGEDFGELAKQYSEDTKSRDAGGELGFIAKGQLMVDNNTVPEFDNAVFAGKVGDIVGPVKTSAGFEIVKIEEAKGKISESFNDWLAGLKKQSKIWRFIK